MIYIPRSDSQYVWVTARRLLPVQKHHLFRFYIRLGFRQTPLQCFNGAQNPHSFKQLFLQWRHWVLEKNKLKWITGSTSGNQHADPAEAQQLETTEDLEQICILILVPWQPRIKSYKQVVLVKPVCTLVAVAQRLVKSLSLASLIELLVVADLQIDTFMLERAMVGQQQSPQLKAVGLKLGMRAQNRRCQPPQQP